MIVLSIYPGGSKETHTSNTAKDPGNDIVEAGSSPIRKGLIATHTRPRYPTVAASGPRAGEHADFLATFRGIDQVAFVIDLSRFSFILRGQASRSFLGAQTHLGTVGPQGLFHLR